LPPYLTARPADRARVGELKLRDPGQPFLQGYGQLHAGQIGSGATVDAGPERQMAVDAAIDDHRVRVGKHLGVAVGRWEAQQHAVARAHRAASYLDLAGHNPRLVTGE
jgi:hypothetical protein